MPGESTVHFFPTIGFKASAEGVRELVERYLAEHSLLDAVSAPMELEEIVVSHSLLDDLREVSSEVKARFSSPWGKGDLIDVGLCVGDELSYSCYDWCTPIHCATIASTGVGGTHFSLLVVDGKIGADSPTVMTTPANMAASVIVGENLFDFLCLGSAGGNFLDSLAGSDRSVLEHFIDASGYPGKPFSEWIAKPTADYPYSMLPFLVNRLKLRPWSDGRRFEELQEKYASLLRLPPDLRR